jgi:iron complex outermembrane receptor protein
MSKSFWLLSAGLTALATPAYAQPPQDTTTTNTSGTENAAVQTNENGQPDIVVTAQGRRQLLQDVPLAVQAVNGEQLQNSGANDIRQLNQLAPSLLVSSTASIARAAASASTNWARSSGSRCCAARKAPCSAATPRPA